MKDNDRKFFTLYAICLLTAAFTLRPMITCVGPLVQEIKVDLNISSGIAGMLTTIPIIIFAVTAFFAGAILPHFKTLFSSVTCFLITIAGILIRSYAGTVGLYTGTVLIGLGLGILNVMIPALNREKMPQRVGLLTGFYNVGINLMAGLGSGMAYPISQKLGGWRPAMAIWAVIPLAAIPLWIILCTRKQFDDHTGDTYSPIQATKKFYSPKVLRISIMMALQSFVYYSVIIAWWPSMLSDKGLDATLISHLTTAIQLIGLVPAFIVPVKAVNPKNHKFITILGGGSYLLCTFLYLVGNSLPVLILACVILGISAGSCLSFILTLISISGKSQAETTWVSGFVQTFGYALSAAGPAIFGVIVDKSGSWTTPLMLVIVLSIAYILTGFAVSKDTSSIQVQ